MPEAGELDTSVRGKLQNIAGWESAQLDERIAKLQNRSAIGAILKVQSPEFVAFFLRMLKSDGFKPTPADIPALKQDFERAGREFEVLIRGGRLNEAITYSDNFPHIDFSVFSGLKEVADSVISHLKGDESRSQEIGRFKEKFPGLFQKESTGNIISTIPAHVVVEIAQRFEDISKLMSLRQREIADAKKRFCELIELGDTKSAFVITQKYLDVDFYEGEVARDSARLGYAKAFREMDFNTAATIIAAFNIPADDFKDAVEMFYRAALARKNDAAVEVLKKLFSRWIDFEAITVVRPTGPQPAPNPGIDPNANTDLRTRVGNIDPSMIRARRQRSKEPSFQIDRTLFIPNVVTALLGDDVDKVFEAAKGLEKNTEREYPELAAAVKQFFTKLLRDEFIDHAHKIAQRFDALDYIPELREAYMYHMQNGNIRTCLYISEVFDYQFPLFDAFGVDVQAGYSACLEQNRTEDIQAFEGGLLAQWANLPEVKAEFLRKQSAGKDAKPDEPTRKSEDDDSEEIELGDDEDEEEIEPEFDETPDDDSEEVNLGDGNEEEAEEEAEEIEPEVDGDESSIRQCMIEVFEKRDRQKFNRVYELYPDVVHKIYFDFLREGLFVCANNAESFLPRGVVFESSDIQQAAHQGVLASLREGRIENTKDMHKKYLGGEIRYIDGYHDAVRDGFYNLLISGYVDEASEFRSHFGSFTDFSGIVQNAYDYLNQSIKPNEARAVFRKYKKEITAQ